MSRVAIVTGAGRGIGAATVRRLAADGWCVLAVDRAEDDPTLPYPLASKAELDSVVASCHAGERVAARVVDVREIDALTEAVSLTEATWGGLDAAIAVAGVIGGGQPQWELDPGVERTLVDVVLGGVLNLARAAVPALLRRPEPRSGRFLAVSSTAAIRGLPLLAAYCAAKAGVAGLIRSLAVELGPTGVTANAVAPGSTDTEVLVESARLYGLPEAASFAVQQPIHRLVTPDEVAATLAYLAGSDTGAITGAEVAVDGGLHL